MDENRTLVRTEVDIRWDGRKWNSSVLNAFTRTLEKHLSNLEVLWVMDKRDWKEAKRRENAATAGEKIPTPGKSLSTSLSPQSPSSSSLGANTQASADDPETNAYPPEIDEMWCLQCMIQRYARKMHGHIFGEMILIRSHTVLSNPATSSSAATLPGGGLAFAFQQVIRDPGLPPTAGGVLVSPWTSSPRRGSRYSSRARSGHLHPTTGPQATLKPHWEPARRSRRTAGQRRRQSCNGDASHTARGRETVVRVTSEYGAPAEIRNQIQLYTTNDLLIHPLVLRDKIVTPHRAANPEKYPVSDAVKKLHSAKRTNKTDTFLAHDVILPTRKLAVFATFEIMSTGHTEDDVLAGDPVVYHGEWAESPERDGSSAMVRERVATHGVVRPRLEPEPALHISPVHLGIISARWAQVYLAGGSGGGGEVERVGEWWSFAWALDDADERPPPSSLIVRCDTAEALALARAAAATKRKQNARLAAAASVSGTRKWRTQDGEDKGKKAARSRPAGELCRRLSRGHGRLLLASEKAYPAN
ncbi:hypothetical protein V8E53_004479 [Lactarius tabidus]